MSTIELAQALLIEERESERAAVLSEARLLEARKLLEWSHALDSNPQRFEVWRDLN